MGEMQISDSVFGLVTAPFVKGDAGNKRAEAVAAAELEINKGAEPGPRQQIFKLQAACGILPEMDFPLQHLFAPHVYVRTIFIPKGGMLVGKIHKHAHANILSAGRVRVFTELGGEQLLTGPLQMVSAPGTKRVVFAEEDTVWTTIHSTEKTDLAEIEAEVIASSYEEYEMFKLRSNEVPK
jgi:hypothetical protein